MTPTTDVRVAIVGAGFSGLGMAIRLKQEGISDFVVLERADDLGGTWRDNSYPGCACDVPSHLYLRGKRVAVIGTGASAIQFVPRIQPKVERLYLFQRTAPWVLPRPEHRISEIEKRVLRAVPATQLMLRAGMYWGGEMGILGLAYDQRLVKPVEALGRHHLRSQVRDPELRAKLTPSFRLGCKRVLASDDYYPALTQPNAEVVTQPIARVRKQSIVAEDGSAHAVDTIIFGTGFHVTDNPLMTKVRGRGGISLADVWQGSPQAYLGMTVPGFPNGFLIVGPNTGLGNNSILFMIEAQVRYILGALKAMDAHGLSTIEVRPDVHAAFQAEVQGRMPGTVWTDGGCKSWYLDANGRNTTLWPDFTWRYALRTRRFDLDDYRARLDLADGHRPIRARAAVAA